VAQRDRVPGLGVRPTSSWQPQEVVADRYYVELGADVPGGTYSVGAGMYDPTDGTRVAATSPDGERLAEDFVSLGGIRVESP